MFKSMSISKRAFIRLIIKHSLQMRECTQVEGVTTWVFSMPEDITVMVRVESGQVGFPFLCGKNIRSFSSKFHRDVDIALGEGEEGEELLEVLGEQGSRWNRGTLLKFYRIEYRGNLRSSRPSWMDGVTI